ncbi:MAG TPA: serine/threonine-protein kinase [Pseudomonadota bacterium]|nr:serine/threonine-protein kinase [Pseudomonadota bacterium]
MSTPGQNDPLVGKVLADRFEILSRIGEGGTGVVYKAKQITVDRTVAIKVLGAHVSSDPTWVKRFHNEARAAARLDHPNTVRLIDFGETKEGLLFIAMEFLHGRALSDEIVRLGKLPVQRALRILSQVCQSLQEAHGQGIIHRDIKPDNVFLVEMKGGGDFVKVLDFSVAKMEDNAQQTRAGTVFGTPAYMSPEQARGVKLTPHSDIYACGIVAYEMLTGKPPFEAALPMEVVMMHLRQKPAPLVGFPEPVARLVMKALEKTVDRRQQSADEMHRECLQVLDQLFPGQTPSAGLPAVEPATRMGPVSGPQPVQSVPSSSGAPPMAPPPAAGPPPAGPPPMGLPPPAAPPPTGATPPAAGPPPAAAPQASPEQKTVYGQAAPNLPPSAPAAGAANRTQAIDASGGGISSTVFMPGGGAGGTALSPQAIIARQQATAPRKRSGSAGPKPLFWVGWALIGVSLGMLLHVLFT